MSDNGECHYELTVGQAIGDSFSTLVGIMSALAVIIYTIWVTCLYRRMPRNMRTLKRGIVILVASLLASDLLQGIGAAMDAKWANERSSHCGEYCTAQGALRLMGQTGDALSILGIAVSTFASIWFPAPHVRGLRSTGLKTAAIYVGIVWSYLLLWPIIGISLHHDYNSPKQLFFAPTPAWCWISDSYQGAKLAAEYVWLWLTCAVTIVLYVGLGLLFCDVIVPSSRWPHWPRRVHKHDNKGAYGDRRTAIMMISYPIAYVISVLPLSIVRWIIYTRPELQTKPATVSANLVVVAIFNLSGFFNVLLLYMTRPDIVVFVQREESDRDEGMQSNPSLSRVERPPSGAASSAKL